MTTVKMRCQCGQLLAVPVAAAGKLVACPKCAAKLRVPESSAASSSRPGPQALARQAPAATDSIKIRCPCGQVLAARKSAAGQTIACPKCGIKLRVPGAASESPARPAPPLVSPVDFDPFTDSDFQTLNPLVPAPASRGAANPHAPTSSVHSLAAHSGGGPTDGIRHEYLKHEASIRGVGLLYYCGAGATMLAAAAGIVGVVRMAGQAAPGAAEAGFVIGMCVAYLSFGTLYAFIGYGLRSLQNWARVTAGLFAVLGLIGFPVGTIISVYILMLMFSEKGAYVCSDGYRRAVAATPHIKYRTPLWIWIALVFLALLIIAGVIITAVGQKE